MLTDQELRQAVFAFGIIEDRGDPDVFALLMKEASTKAPAANEWDSMTINQRLHVARVAAELSKLLGESRDRCEQAAADVLGPGRQRLRFQALIGYAIDLIGPCRELTGESPFASYDAPPPAIAAQGRPSTIRIVADERGVA